MKLCNPSLSPANVLAHPCCNDDDDDHEDNDDDLDVDDDNDCQSTCTPVAIFPENAAATSRAFCQVKTHIRLFNIPFNIL